jgi:hypothetical protein
VCARIANDVETCEVGTTCKSVNGEQATCRIVNEKEYLWVGILLGILGAIIVNVGLNVKKWSMNKILVEEGLTQDDVDDVGVRKIVTNPYWLFGFTIFIAGNISNFLALKYAPQSILAPLGSVSLVANVWFIVFCELYSHSSLLGCLCTAYQ